MSDTVKTVRVELTGGSDSFRKAFSEASRSADTLSKSLDVIGKNIEGSLGNAAAGIGPLGEALAVLGPAGIAAAAGLGAVAAGIGGIVAFTAAATKGLVDLGGKLSDLSEQTGLSTTTLQELRFAGSLVGVSMESAAGAVGKMQKAIVEGDTVFARLGLNLEKLRKLDTGAQFDAVAAAIRSIKDPAQQTTAAMEAFGKGGVSILPLIKSDTAAAREEFHRLGLEISEPTAAAADALGDEFTKVGLAFEGVKNQLAAGIVESGVLTTATEALKEALGKLAVILQENKGLISAVFESLPGLVDTGTTLIKELVGEFDRLATVLGGPVYVAFKLLGKGVGSDIAESIRQINLAQKLLAEGRAAAAAGGGIGGKAAGDKTFVGKGGEEAAAEAERARQKELAELRKQDTIALKAEDDATKLHALSVAKLAEAEGAAISPLQKKIAAIEAERDALVSKAQADFVAFQNAASVSNISAEETDRMEGLTNSTIENANATRDAAVAQAIFETNVAEGNKAWGAYIKNIVDAQEGTEKFEKALRAASAEMAAGISQDFQALGGLLEDFGAASESVAVTFANSMSQAFAVVERSIKNGELSFADLAQSVGSVFKAGKQGGVGAGILSGVGSGAAIGGLFGPEGALIGAGIGGIVGAIGGIFHSDPVKKAQQEAGRALGYGISKELAQTLLDDAKRTGKSITEVAKQYAAKIKAEQDKANLDTLRAGVDIAKGGAQDLLGLLDKLTPKAQAAGQALVAAVADAMAANGLGVLATGDLAKSDSFNAVQGAVAAGGQIFQGQRQAGGITTDLLANGGAFSDALREQAVAAALAAGKSQEEANKIGLAAVAPLLRDQLEASIQSGQKLSAQTQQLIDDAKANGINIIADPTIAILAESKEQTALLRQIAGRGAGIGGDFASEGAKAKGIPGFATGGIFNAPASGGLFMGHGLEAVVPLGGPNMPRMSSSISASGAAALLGGTSNSGGGGNVTYGPGSIAPTIQINGTNLSRPELTAAVGDAMVKLLDQAHHPVNGRIDKRIDRRARG